MTGFFISLYAFCSHDGYLLTWVTICNDVYNSHLSCEAALWIFWLLILFLNLESYEFLCPLVDDTFLFYTEHIFLHQPTNRDSKSVSVALKRLDSNSVRKEKYWRESSCGVSTHFWWQLWKLCTNWKFLYLATWLLMSFLYVCNE